VRGLVLGDLIARGERGRVGQRLQDGVNRGMTGAARRVQPVLRRGSLPALLVSGRVPSLLPSRLLSRLPCRLPCWLPGALLSRLPGALLAGVRSRQRWARAETSGGRARAETSGGRARA
jgi:hypothetical protein